MLISSYFPVHYVISIIFNLITSRCVGVGLLSSDGVSDIIAEIQYLVFLHYHSARNCECILFLHPVITLRLCDHANTSLSNILFALKNNK